MATKGVDESAFLGSAVSVTPTAKQPDAAKDKVEQISQARKGVQAVIAPAVDVVLEVIDRQIAKESDLETVRSRSILRIKQGQLQREALSDELLYSTGRLDAFMLMKQQLEAIRTVKGGGDG